MAATPPPSQGLSLFPSPSSSLPPANFRAGTPRSRRSESRERRAPTPQERREATSPQVDPSAYAAPPRTSSRHPPQQQQQQQQQQRARRPSVEQAQTQRREPPRRQTEPAPATVQTATPVATVQQGRQPGDVPHRTDTAFSEANTLVRSNSGRSRSSIAKMPLYDEPSTSSEPPPPLQSIFPTYNPDVPLNQQEYLPTQLSPTRIPRAVISRQQVFHGEDEDDDDYELDDAAHQQAAREPQRQQHVQSPEIREGTRWPRRAHQEPPAVPKPCSTEQLRSLWKVTNGWKASQSEGRVYCLRMSRDKDAPVYTLSSSSAQPFYNLRLDPTSASAVVSLTKYDPSKPYKVPAKNEPASSSSSIRSGTEGSSGNSGNKSSDNKHWHEALNTTLEEESRRHPPNDGLVALLMPTPAAKMAVEKASDPAAVMVAEQECGRLVWDEDSAHYYLVHPTLAHPFCITKERSPAYSRVEYTLEHNESPQHLAKLTRDGTGGGWLEVDTTIASQIDCFYIIDVAVTALILAAASDDRNSPAPIEPFEPPPAVLARAAGVASAGSGRLSKLGLRSDDKLKRGRVEEFEIDLESQDDSLKGRGSKTKNKKQSSEDKLPFLIRVVVKIFKGLFKCFIFFLTIGFKCVAVVFKGLYKCVGSKY